MKKITFYFMTVLLLGFSYSSIAQTLDQNAAWPNMDWSVTGTFNSDPTAFEADPTTTSNFAFDDDDAGNPSADDIAAESPIIDLTAAYGAGETWLTVTGDYSYNFLEDSLTLEYWDADAGAWVVWDTFVDTVAQPQDDFCAAARDAYTSPILNVVSFTATQQSGFRYRIYFDDDAGAGGGAWEWGFCFDAPTITSAMPPSCPDPNSLTAIPVNTTEVTLEWVEFGTATSWNIEIVDITAGGTQTMTPTYSGVSSPYAETTLTPGNDYEFYVQSDCGGTGNSNWVGPVAWSQLNIGYICEEAIVVTSLPYSTSDDTSNFGDDYSGAPGDETSCGTDSGYLGGDDVVYEYTATSDTSINVSMTPGGTWSGIFVYTDCADIGTACVAGIADSSSDERTFDLIVSNGTTYYFVISTWPTPQSIPYTFNITENTCTDATVTYTVVDDCDNSGGFNIIVDVIDLGSATSIDVNDGQGTITQTIGLPATFTYGPYVNGTEVTITITDNDDSNCNQDSGPLTQEGCPPPNDTIAGAIPIVPSPEGTGCAAAGFTLPFSTDFTSDSGLDGTCNGVNTGLDQFFTWTATSDALIYNNLAPGNPGIVIRDDMGVEITCAQTFEAADYVLSGWTIGQDLIIQIYDFAGSTSDVAFCLEEFTLPEAPECATDPTPMDGAIDVPVGVVTFSWTAPASGITPTGYNIYAGETPAGNDYGLIATVTDTFVDLNINAYETVLYWIVVPVNGPAEAMGCPVWSFTTEDAPLPPVNDECPDATALTPGGNYADYPVDGTVLGATDDAEPASCSLTGPGVWYSVVVPADGNIIIETGPDAATGNGDFDSVMEAFSGNCGALTSIECDDDDADTGLYSLLDLSGLTPGSTIYIRVWAYNGGSTDPFSISAYNATLSVDDFETQSLFSYYPNPVTNNLTLNAQKDIQNVVVYNMLGQQVMRTAPNAVNSEVDMSNLNTGSYFVQVTIDNTTETIRIIKN